MYNKFKEYDSFNLSEINKEMLDDWTRQGLFGQSIKDLLLLCFTRVRRRPTVCRASIT